ncbi:unnamed protein product, partial [Polarella glacialis]
CAICWHALTHHLGAACKAVLSTDTRMVCLALATLQTLERRCGRLNSFLGKLKWPPLTQFYACREFHTLPLRSCKAELQNLPKQKLEYLVGFFDGDGCVDHGSLSGGCGLKVAQSYDAAEVLLIYRQAFGGGIYLDGQRARGLKKPGLVWSLRGIAAQRVAKILGELPSLKQPQLLLAASWSTSHEHRIASSNVMKSLKREKPEHKLVCTWPYLAGFFDAEGCIRVKPLAASIVLEVSQRDRAVLELIKDFLNHEIPNLSVGIYPTSNAFSLQVTNPKASKDILRRLLAADLTTKRKEANVALSVCPSSHVDVRCSLALLKGNQSKYRRLDAAGMLRAKAINRLQSLRSHRRGCGGKDVSKLELDIVELQLNHAVCCAETRIACMRQDIRALLGTGATVTTA